MISVIVIPMFSLMIMIMVMMIMTLIIMMIMIMMMMMRRRIMMVMMRWSPRRIRQGGEEEQNDIVKCKKFSTVKIDRTLRRRLGDFINFIIQTKFKINK